MLPGETMPSHPVLPPKAKTAAVTNEWGISLWDWCFAAAWSTGVPSPLAMRGEFGIQAAADSVLDQNN